MRAERKKALLFAWRVAVVCLVNILIIVMLLDSGGARALSKYGSTGSEVTQIQLRLQELGYEPGATDGIYGTRTKNAVIAFQRDRGLSDDGIVGPKTLEALGLTGGGGSGGGGYGGFSESDLRSGVLAGCRLEYAEFDRCDLSQAELFGTPLAGISLVGNTIAGIRFGAAESRELRGAVVDRMQALELARMLGFEIEEL